LTNSNSKCVLLKLKLISASTSTDSTSAASETLIQQIARKLIMISGVRVSGTHVGGLIMTKILMVCVRSG
jgi:hypothetical protein